MTRVRSAPAAAFLDACARAGASLALAATLCGPAFAQAPPYVIELYSQLEFGGVSVQLRGDEPTLASRGFDRRAQSVVVTSGTWQLCPEPNFAAGCREFGPGRYPTLGVGLARRVSSARPLRPFAEAAPVPAPVAEPPAREAPPPPVPTRPSRGAVPIVGAPAPAPAPMPVPAAGVSVPVAETSGLTLFMQTDFGGERFGIVADTPSFAGTPFDDRAASVIVYQGTWEICSEPRYGGNCAVYRPGRYPSMGGLAGQASSLRRLP